MLNHPDWPAYTIKATKVSPPPLPQLYERILGMKEEKAL